MQYQSGAVGELNPTGTAAILFAVVAVSMLLTGSPRVHSSELLQLGLNRLNISSVDSPSEQTQSFTFSSAAVSPAFVKVSGGTLEEVALTTFANEARIDVAPWGVQFKPFGSVQNYTGSIAIPDWYFPFPAEASGNHLGPQTLSFTESFRDASSGPDQIWKDLKIQLVRMFPRPGQYDIGPLPADGYPDGYAAPGTAGNNQHSLAALPDTEFGPGASVADHFTFSHAGVPAGSSASLLIETEKFSSGSAEKATVLFLYNSAGDLVAYDESPTNYNTGTVIVTDRTDSRLEFNGDNPLPAGTYTLVVAGAGANADLAGVTIDSDLLGTGAVDYQIGIETTGLQDACSAERIVSMLTSWHMLSVPCVALAGSTMADLVVYDELRDATAPDSWVAFVYDTDAGGYLPLAAESRIPDPGVGFWFNTTEPVTLRLPGGSVPTDNCRENVSDSTECGAVDFPESSWSLLGNALEKPVAYADLNAYHDSATPCDPDGCEINDLHNLSASMQLWVYDHYRGNYTAFAQEQVKVAMPWEGYWARIDLLSPFNSDWTLSMPAFAVPIPQIVDIPLPEDGCFDMGSPAGEVGRRDNESLHEVCIDRPFGIGKFELTFAQWDAWSASVAHSDGGFGRDDRPVINVNMRTTDAWAYADWLSRQTGRNYALPTEAQWEYSARAGTPTAFHTGINLTTDQANIDGALTSPVGQYPANAFGLHDMHGNVAEMTCSPYDNGYGRETRCGDLFTEFYIITNINGLPETTTRPYTVRGGSWSDAPTVARSAARGPRDPEARSNNVGFRVVRN